MEIVYKEKDIAGIIKDYYRKCEGITVQVETNFQSNSVDDMFRIVSEENGEKKSAPLSDKSIRDMIKKLLESFGYEVISMDINYGGGYKKESGQKVFVPHIHSVKVECDFSKKYPQVGDSSLIK